MEDLIECEYCSRIWDGNAQCPCRMYDSSDEESEEIDVYTEWLQENGNIPNDLNTIWVSDRVSDENIIWNELGSLGYWEYIYSTRDNGLIEESSPVTVVENNVSGNKEKLKVVIDIIFNNRSNIPGGEYIEIMNLVKSVYENQ